MLVLGIVFGCACIFAYMAFIRGFSSDSGKPVGEYNGVANMQLSGDKECYKIAMNKYGHPIFENDSAAFKQATIDYENAINLIYDTFQEEYDLKPFSKKSYQMYMTLGWQIPTDDENIRMQGSDLTQFLDIYENGDRRWFLTSGGWVLK